VPLDHNYDKPLAVTEAVSKDFPGFYILTATPPTIDPSDAWQAGENVLSLTAHVPPDDGQPGTEVRKGQTLAVVLIPS
jgi:hypothetical protein